MMLNGIKILIGDDSILARKQLKDIVSTYGTPVFLEASNGQDAIDLYNRVPSGTTVVVLNRGTLQAPTEVDEMPPPDDDFGNI